MTIKARFYVSEITERASTSHLAVSLLPVSRKTDDNVDWSKYTPSGKFEINVSAETGAYDEFKQLLGKDVSITIDAIATE